MKVVFLCSSLEPGCDGVGDYVRRLSCELISQGNQVIAIALYDRHIQVKVLNTQVSDNVTLQVLRLPSVWSAGHRFTLAKEWIDTFNPHWISLQYVAFGFHDKGLPFDLSKWISILAYGRKLHFMFHELWVGMAIESSIKLVLWGWVQKKLIHLLIATLKPTIIHTQTQLYQVYLKQLGFNCTILPLFSNISVSDDTRKRILNRQMTQNQSNRINLAVFGAIYPNAPIREFAHEVASFSRQNKIYVTLTFIGRCGSEQDRWLNEWEESGLSATIVGEQPPELIHKFLDCVEIGIATTPFALLDKSASVAVMREHGLPIVCITGPWHPRGNVYLHTADEGITSYIPGNIEVCLTGKYSTRPTYTSSEVASDLTSILEANIPNSFIK